MPQKIPVALLCISLSAAFADVNAAQKPLDPQRAVTLADVQMLLAGKFEARVVEPGIVKYEEVGGPRVVEVWLSILDPGRTLDSLKETIIGHGEPVEDVPGVGDIAIYRPQSGRLMVDRKTKAGENQSLEIIVHNVEAADAKAATKRLAIELAKRAAAKP